MAERRVPMTVPGPEGRPREGEVVIVRNWSADFEPGPTVEFSIVLSERPLAPDTPLPTRKDVVVCAPASPVRLSRAVSEPGVAYGADGEAEAPLRLGRKALAAYCAGALLTARPVTITPTEIFPPRTFRPRLGSLAQELLAAGGRDDALWRGLDETLAWPNKSARLPRPDSVRGRLRKLLDRDTDGPDLGAPQARKRLSQVVEGASPATSPTLADDAARLRCLIQERDAATELAAMRAYVEAVRPGADDRDFLTDHALAREGLSFIVLLQEPHRLDSMRATFEMFRAGYAETYLKHHERYWRCRASCRSAIEATAPLAEALMRLNRLHALGRGIGRAALAAHRRLARQAATCPQKDLQAALQREPVCPSCGLTLQDSPSVSDEESVVRRLKAALARQQGRLAGEAVRRVLAQGGERVEQFLRVAQASDVSALVRVLDDELLSFLAELLDQPPSPSFEALELLRELGRAHPVVDETEIDAATETFRRLLEQRLASRRAAHPARPATVRLAPAPGAS